MKLSLTARLLLAGSIVLIAFLGLTGWTLDRAFRDYAEHSLQERLQAHAVGLIAAAELDDLGKLHMAAGLPEARYNTVDSGLYAQITSNDGEQNWQSPSMQHQNITLPRDIAPGARSYQRVSLNGDQLYTFSLGITFDLSEVIHEGYTFTVAENLIAFNEQLAAFRRNLWGWLSGVTVVLLIVQGLVLRWSLTPLRDVAEDLGAIESGRQQLLEGRYPKEMRGLTDNINALLVSQREHLDRYRHTLSDLAHSLKTPLAVMRGEIDKTTPHPDRASVIDEQVRRMNEIVDYQLQRAATSGRLPLTTPPSITAAASKLIKSLNKVYADKQVECQTTIAENAIFHGEEGDLLELLGNLLDNAYKWCTHNVHLTAMRSGNNQLLISIEDDGPGIAAQKAQAVLQRGVRGDTTNPGHGIGLAVVQDIMRVYHGKLNIERSPTLGGAKITLALPSP